MTAPRAPPARRLGRRVERSPRGAPRIAGDPAVAEGDPAPALARPGLVDGTAGPKGPSPVPARSASRSSSAAWRSRRLIAILLSAGGRPHTFLPGVSTEAIRILSFFVSLGVAALAAYEEVMQFGERWRHYRRTAELLKTLGWQYLTLSGVFKRFRTHDDAFTAFTERVEDVLNQDVEGYLSAVTAEGGDRRPGHRRLAAASTSTRPTRYSAGVLVLAPLTHSLKY